MSGALAGRSASVDADKGRVETTKVRRYRPGQKPHWILQTGEEGVDKKPLDAGEAIQPAAPVIVARRANAEEPARVPAAPQIVSKSRDLVGEGLTALTARKFVIPVTDASVTPIQEEPGPGLDELEDADAIAARREALRQRLLQKQEDDEKGKGAEEANITESEDEDDEDEDEEEEEDDEDEDDEEDDEDFRPLARPVFVPRSDRDTLAERDLLLQEEEEEERRIQARLEQRKEETKAIVAARLAEEEAQLTAAAVNLQALEDIDTDDDKADPEKEYDEWKGRELQRLMRDHEEREKQEKEAEERRLLKSMTEEERLEYLARRVKAPAKEKSTSRINFLQKYYHRGAFFQTEAEYKGESVPLVGDLIKRDFSVPTGEDVVDKSTLPKVMQVKNFGRRSRSKWTHLAAEDTTFIGQRKKEESEQSGHH